MEPNKQIQVNWGWFCVWLCFCLASPACSQNRSLLARATKIADVTGWMLPRLVENTPYWLTYHWLTDEKVLFIEYGPGHFRFYQFDLRTRRKSYLRRFSRLFGDTHRDMEVSPRGRWILWGGSTSDQDRYFVARLDGSGFKTYRPGFNAALGKEGSFPLWLPNPPHWIELVVSSQNDNLTRAIVHSLNHPQNIRTQLSMPPISYQQIESPILPGNRLGVWRSYQEGARSVRIAVIGIGKRDKKAIDSVVTFPKPWRLETAQFSPDGRRIAWFLTASATSRQHGQKRISLWISDLNGRHFHELGSLPYPNSLKPTSTDWLQELTFEPRELRWLPSGKRLSFVYKNALWTLPR
jgi:hypothetical protein